MTPSESFFRYLACLLLSALCLAHAGAQVFSGLQAQRYTFPFEGTPYWSEDGFQTGTLRYNGNTYKVVSVAINAHLNCLELRDPENGLIYLPDPAKVEELRIGDASFRYFFAKDRLQEGWYQILYERDIALYRRVDRVLQHVTDREIPDFFSMKDSYWCIDADGKVKRISRQRAERMIQKERETVHPTQVPPFKPTLQKPAPAAAASQFAIGWFDDQSHTPPRTQEDTTRATVTYQNKIYEVGTSVKGRTRATISGVITDLKSGKPLEGIAVHDSTKTWWTVTGKDGRYSLTLPTGRHLLHFGGNLTWQDADIEIVLYGTGGLDIALAENAIDLEGAHISAESVQQHRTAYIGIEKIQLDRIKHIPVAFGEADLIKAILTMPGVQTVGEASSGYNVRGGSVDQNLVLFNGGTVYNPNHLFGIFSSFNADAVREAELYKSSIPAEFGGRISSVLDIRSREGNTERVKANLGIGLLTSHACIDGPIGSENTTFLLAGRTTYSNWILNLIPQESYYHGSRASFQDFNASLTHRFGEKDKLTVSGYGALDRFSFGVDTSFRYGNLNVSATWQHQQEDGGSFEMQCGYDRFANSTHSMLEGDHTDYQLHTVINQGFVRMKATRRLGETNTLTWGIGATYYALNPGHMFPASDTSLIADRRLPLQQALEPAVFVSDQWDVSDRFTLNGGLRLGAFWSLTHMAFYAMPEIRISARYSIRENLTLKAGINTMRQNIHLITNTSSISPMDTWTLVTDRIRPQDGYQAATGIYWTVGRQKKSVDLSVEAYWKQSWHNLDYISGASLAMNDHLADDLLEVLGRSYGVELMARKTKGSLNGWVSYVYSRAWYQESKDYGKYSINNGAAYRAPHDKPHNLKLVANYEFTHRYSVSVNLDWSTGRPVTIPIGTYVYGGKTRLAYSNRNGHRIPDYFRIDAAFNIEPSHYLKKLTHMSFTIGCYNVTGRKNAYSVFYTVQGNQAVGQMLSVFATQIPYLTLNLKF